MRATPGLKKFALKALLLAAPFALVYAVPFFILLGTGELLPLDRVIEKQALPRPAYFNFFYNPNETNYFKLRSAVLRKPEVVVLGSSRMLKFRTLFFKGASFYNAGLGAQKLSHMKEFVERIPESGQPKLLILGLDQWFFNPKGLHLTDAVYEPALKEWRPFKIFWNQWKNVYRDLYSKRISLARLFQSSPDAELIGAGARMTKSGFRNDGSMGIYKMTLMEEEKERSGRLGSIAVAVSMIDKAAPYFERSDSASEESLRTLDEILSLCKHRGIRVVGFLPPYAPSVYAKMLSVGKGYEYLSGLSGRVAPLFEKAGFGFFDFSDVKDLGYTDGDFHDGLHGSQKVYLDLFIRMTEKNDALARVTDIPYLRSRLAKSSQFETFGEET